MNDLESLSASDAALALAQGKIKAEHLVLACLDRIGQRERTIKAWVSLGKEHAIVRARQLDRGASTGLLHGLPIGVKDLFDTYDLPTAYGSPIYRDHQPATDAVSIALMRKAGGIILGKTVTTEFATFKSGPTANPHNTAHTPGGSSSGSAAAVADFMVPLATGTQTAASIIRPASFCGVVGYKPSYGKVSIAGVKSLSISMDTLGCFGRTV
ncbi:MAG: amidase, partial [Polynucleobacter sp.]